MSDQSASRIVNDLPSDADLLGFQSYSAALTRLIVSRDTGTPFTIGIFGPWGSGKTTLMRMIDHDLKERHVVTVWFNAWQYTEEESLWAALLQVILRRLKREGTLWQRTIFALKMTVRRFDQEEAITQLGQVLLKLILVALPVVVAWILAQTWLKDVQTSILTWIGGGASAIIALSLFAKPIIDQFRQNVMFDTSKLWKTDDYQEHIAFLDTFKDYLSDILDSIPSTNQQRLVVFIDDLDRCTEDGTLQVLDAIKLFLDVPHCIFVLGLDQDVVLTAIATKYKENVLARDSYLGKIIQLPFQLPPLTRRVMHSYVGQLQVTPPDRRCLQVFVEGLVANPREVKRVLNIFSLLWELASAREEVRAIIAPVRLAKIVVIQHSHHDLHKLLREDPSLIIALERFFRSGENITTTAPPEQMQAAIRVLRQSLTERFSIDELRTLCFDLGIDYEDIAGDSRQSKAFELVQYAQRRGILVSLANAVKAARPSALENVSFEALTSSVPTPGQEHDVDLPEALEPFSTRANLKRMFLLHELKPPDEDDANFGNLQPQEVEAYFTLTSSVEPDQDLGGSKVFVSNFGKVPTQFP